MRETNKKQIDNITSRGGKFIQKNEAWSGVRQRGRGGEGCCFRQGWSRKASVEVSAK